MNVGEELFGCQEKKKWVEKKKKNVLENTARGSTVVLLGDSPESRMKYESFVEGIQFILFTFSFHSIITIIIIIVVVLDVFVSKIHTHRYKHSYVPPE